MLYGVARKGRSAAKLTEAPSVMGDVPSDEQVERFLRRYGGVAEDEAKAFVEALKRTASQEVLGTIVGDEPIPTSVLELRSLRLRRLSANLKRTLTVREIAAVFRISRQQATTLAKRMEASYPQVVTGFRRTAVLDAVSKIELPAVALNVGATIKVHFKDPSGLNAAKALIDDAEVAADAEYGERLLTLTVGESTVAETYEILTGVLGLEEQVTKARADAKAAGETTAQWRRRGRRS